MSIVKDAIETQMPYHFNISSKQIVVFLACITFFLLLLHLVAFWMSVYVERGSSVSLRIDQYFNFNNENNFPSLFSSFLLFFSSCVLLFIYKTIETTNIHRFKWLVLSFTFLFLALDEALEIHERVEVITRKVFTTNLNGLLLWTCVVPYILFFVVVAFYSFRFVMHLPKYIRNIVVSAGFIYVFAAAGIEALEGYLKIVTLGNSIIVFITTTAQELLEMCGIIFFIFGLLKYVSVRFKAIAVVFS